MGTKEPEKGDIAILHKPYLGYHRIELIEEIIINGWLASARAVWKSRSTKTSLS